MKTQKFSAVQPETSATRRATLWRLVLYGSLSALCASPTRAPAGEASEPTDALAEHVVAKNASESQDVARVDSGLLALFAFRNEGAAEILDISGRAERLNLIINSLRAARQTASGLVIRSPAKIVAAGSAKGLIGAIRNAGELTVEAWIKPANNDQSGPARIITISANANQRNFTLGQDGDRLDVRLRTTSTNGNGLPSLTSPGGAVTNQAMHVAYTRDRSGTARLYLDGEEVATATVEGDLSNWDDKHQFLLANETTSDRPWLGHIYLAAIYGRALNAAELQQNYKAGHSQVVRAGNRQSDADRLFEHEVAPLLANNCLECHDSAAHEGGLDLSKKAAALAGGDSGEVIAPGSADDSMLWHYVESGDMPPDGDPLPAESIALLKKWLDGGAAWSIDVIDPALYEHESAAAEQWVRRLTRAEYVQTVRGAVGVDISEEAAALLPADLRADGFSNTAYNLNVDLEHIDAYAQLATLVAERMDVVKFAAKYSKNRSLSTDNTMREFVAGVGEQLMRGPLSDREITNYCGIATTVSSAGGSFNEAAGLIIEAMLQSPRFLYRVERQRGDGSAWPVSGYELASRLSYMVWGAPPDDKLLKAAERGELHEASRLREQVERMLEDSRAVDRSTQFIAEWLNLDHLANLRPDRERFPQWDAALAADMRDETIAYFTDLVWEQDRPLSDLFNAQFTYATPQLAEHYGLKPQSAGLDRYDLTDVPERGGILTQGSVLTVGGDDASMVTRGLFVLHDLLRGRVNDPPPGTDTTPIPSKPGLSQRMVSEQRIANESCGGCHSRFEPLAFGLERFDGLGSYREADEHGNRLRHDGEVLFPGGSKPQTYGTSAELMDMLAESNRIRETITWKLAQFAIGRPLVAADAQVVHKIHREASDAGGTYRDLVLSIATSELVTMIQTEP